jgi:hypothetical protein
MKNFSKKKSNVPAVRQSTDLTNYSFEDHAGEGLENLTPEDKPRAALKIAQPQSYECLKQHEKYIEGLEPGMIFSTSDNRKFSGSVEDKAVLVILARYARYEIEWEVGTRGKFRGKHLPGSEIIKGLKIVETVEDGKKKTSRITVNGTELVDTAVYYCLAFLNGSFNPEELTIDMTSTQWNTAKMLNGYYDGLRWPKKNNPSKTYQPPIYANVYQMYTKFTENEKGAWYLWQFKPITKLFIDSDDPQYNPAHLEYIGRVLDYQKRIDSGVLQFDTFLDRDGYVDDNQDDSTHQPVNF